MKIDVTEDYLDPSDFEQLKTTLLKDEFPWFLSTIVNSDDTLAPDWNTQMVHRFYDNNVPTSSFLQALDPVFTKIIASGMSSLHKVKGNIVHRTENIIEHGYHIDISDHRPYFRTSILYMNTCDGYTKFEDGTIVTSEANRFVTFPTSMRHTGTTCTDAKFRMVLNFNYAI